MKLTVTALALGALLATPALADGMAASNTMAPAGASNTMAPASGGMMATHKPKPNKTHAPAPSGGMAPANTMAPSNAMAPANTNSMSGSH